MIQVIQQGHRQNGLQYIDKREESHMKRTEMKKHFTSMKAAALTMLLSASLMAAAVPASALKKLKTPTIMITTIKNQHTLNELSSQKISKNFIHNLIHVLQDLKRH